jgi:ATP-dependent Clp protease protease subunit
MIKAPKFYERARQIANRVQAPHGRFAAKTQEKRGELFIYDDIGASWFSEGITAKDVAEKLDEMKGVTELDVFINSPGGSVTEGAAILALLDRFPANKTVYVDGIAASIASVIAMAGSKVVMHRSATMMIHEPYTLAMGNAAALRKEAEVLDTMRESIVEAYAKRTKEKCDPKSLRDLMAAETWMTAQDALARGFADEVASDDDCGDPAPGPKKKGPAVEDRSALSPQARFDLAVARARALSEQFAGAGPGQPGQPGTKHNSPATAGKGK